MGQQIHWMLSVRDESKSSFAVMLACGEKVVVGRSRACEIVMKDPSVSRKHCFICVDGNGVLKLIDLGSKHKILLNGEPVQEGCSYVLEHGGEIRFGRGSSIQAECLGEKLSSRADHSGSSSGDERTSEFTKSDHGTAASPVSVNEPVTSSEQNDETHLVEVDKNSDANRDDETKLQDVRAAQPNLEQGLSRPVPKAEKVQDPAVVVGKTLQGKVSQQKGPVPASENSVENNFRNAVSDETAGVDRPGSDPDETRRCVAEASELKSSGEPPADQAAGFLETTMVERPAEAAADTDDETNYVDPAELQKMLKARAAPEQQKEARPAADSDDETNFIDPAELQKLMKRNGGAGNTKGKRSAGPVKSSGNSAASDNDADDETNFIDPAELQKLVKGKSGLFGRKSGGKGAASADTSARGIVPDEESDDETNYVDPAELQKLMKGKAKPSKSKKGRAR